MNQKFNRRAFTSLYIVISFLIMAVSGLVLFLAPPGRIANWSNPAILGLIKSQWQAIHTVFTFLFIIATIFHIYDNWRPLMAYLRSRVQKSFRIRREFFVAGILVTALFILTVGDVPPFSSLMQLSENLSFAWATPEMEPPVPHAELMTIGQIAESTGKPPAELLSNLAREGFGKNEITTKLGKLAAIFNISPQQLYIRMLAEKPAESITGSGFGRMRILELSERLEIPLDVCLLRLHQNGIEAEANSILKELADKAGLNPHTVLAIIRAS
jgi:hypothetical protein